jgi:plastocyanin
VPGRRLLATAALTAGLLGACSAPASGNPASPLATSAVELPPSYRFEPVDIAVQAGTTVTWSNDDHFTHSIQFLDGGLSSDPLVMAPGRTTTFEFETPGVYHYQCHLHPRDMKGSVTVED